MNRRPLLRAAAALALTTALGAAGLACPARDLSVQVTSTGASTLVTACESFRAACSADSCHENSFLCTQDTCQLRDACTVGQNPSWSPNVTMGMRVLLLETQPSSVAIESASPCVPVNLAPCIQDQTGVNGCPCITNPLQPTTPMCAPDPSGDATLACIRDTLAQAIQTAMGNGISFSGFTSTDNVALVTAFFEKPGNEHSCGDTPVLVNPNDCAVANMTAVAGLGTPSGSSTYDITCASCQGGTSSSYGPDNAPCPASTDQCFLQRVASALGSSGL
jgi:hypothetical protein